MSTSHRSSSSSPKSSPRADHTHSEAQRVVAEVSIAAAELWRLAVVSIEVRREQQQEEERELRRASRQSSRGATPNMSRGTTPLPGEESDAVAAAPRRASIHKRRSSGHVLSNASMLALDDATRLALSGDVSARSSRSPTPLPLLPGASAADLPPVLRSLTPNAADLPPVLRSLTPNAQGRSSLSSAVRGGGRRQSSAVGEVPSASDFQDGRSRQFKRQDVPTAIEEALYQYQFQHEVQRRLHLGPKRTFATATRIHKDAPPQSTNNSKAKEKEKEREDEDEDAVDLWTPEFETTVFGKAMSIATKYVTNGIDTNLLALRKTSGGSAPQATTTTTTTTKEPLAQNKQPENQKNSSSGTNKAHQQADPTPESEQISPALFTPQLLNMSTGKQNFESGPLQGEGAAEPEVGIPTGGFGSFSLSNRSPRAASGPADHDDAGDLEVDVRHGSLDASMMVSPPMLPKFAASLPPPVGGAATTEEGSGTNLPVLFLKSNANHVIDVEEKVYIRIWTSRREAKKFHRTLSAVLQTMHTLLLPACFTVPYSVLLNIGRATVSVTWLPPIRSEQPLRSREKHNHVNMLKFVTKSIDAVLANATDNSSSDAGASAAQWWEQKMTMTSLATLDGVDGRYYFFYRGVLQAHSPSRRKTNGNNKPSSPSPRSDDARWMEGPVWSIVDHRRSGMGKRMMILDDTSRLVLSSTWEADHGSGGDAGSSSFGTGSPSPTHSASSPSSPDGGGNAWARVLPPLQRLGVASKLLFGQVGKEQKELAAQFPRPVGIRAADVPAVATAYHNTLMLVSVTQYLRGAILSKDNVHRVVQAVASTVRYAESLTKEESPLALLLYYIVGELVPLATIDHTRKIAKKLVNVSSMQSHVYEWEIDAHALEEIAMRLCMHALECRGKLMLDVAEEWMERAAKLSANRMANASSPTKKSPGPPPKGEAGIARASEAFLRRIRSQSHQGGTAKGEPTAGAAPPKSEYVKSVEFPAKTLAELKGALTDMVCTWGTCTADAIYRLGYSRTLAILQEVAMHVVLPDHVHSKMSELAEAPRSQIVGPLTTADSRWHEREQHAGISVARGLLVPLILGVELTHSALFQEPCDIHELLYQDRVASYSPKAAGTVRRQEIAEYHEKREPVLIEKAIKEREGKPMVDLVFLAGWLLSYAPLLLPERLVSLTKVTRMLRGEDDPTQRLLGKALAATIASAFSVVDLRSSKLMQSIAMARTGIVACRDVDADAVAFSLRPLDTESDELLKVMTDDLMRMAEGQFSTTKWAKAELNAFRTLRHILTTASHSRRGNSVFSMNESLECLVDFRLTVNDVDDNELPALTFDESGFGASNSGRFPSMREGRSSSGQMFRQGFRFGDGPTPTSPAFDFASDSLRNTPDVESREPHFRGNSPDAPHTGGAKPERGSMDRFASFGRMSSSMIGSAEAPPLDAPRNSMPRMSSLTLGPPQSQTRTTPRERALVSFSSSDMHASVEHAATTTRIGSSASFGQTRSTSVRSKAVSLLIAEDKPDDKTSEKRLLSHLTHTPGPPAPSGRRSISRRSSLPRPMSPSSGHALLGCDEGEQQTPPSPMLPADDFDGWGTIKSSILSSVRSGVGKRQLSSIDNGLSQTTTTTTATTTTISSSTAATEKLLYGVPLYGSVSFSMSLALSILADGPENSPSENVLNEDKSDTTLDAELSAQFAILISSEELLRRALYDEQRTAWTTLLVMFEVSWEDPDDEVIRRQLFQSPRDRSAVTQSNKSISCLERVTIGDKGVRRVTLKVAAVACDAHEDDSETSHSRASSSATAVDMEIPTEHRDDDCVDEGTSLSGVSSTATTETQFCFDEAIKELELDISATRSEVETYERLGFADLRQAYTKSMISNALKFSVKRFTGRGGLFGNQQKKPKGVKSEM